MLGGRRVSFQSGIRIGDAVHRRSEIAAVEPKQGRSGRLLRVTVRHAIRVAGADSPAVIEEQDVIYREAATAPTAESPSVPPAPPPEAEITRPVAFDPVMLFRYSAVTFNGHRIHYDHTYATGVEGYPGLVVNGGLTALLLLELGRSQGMTPSRMTARNLRPLFAGQAATLCGRRDGEGWSLWAADPEGRPAVEVWLR
jgi:3-methylfumaryl-CoA hydratase